MNRGFIKPPKTVIAINPDGSVHAVYNSAQEASKDYGLNKHSINKYCSIGRIGMGKRWLYEEDFRRYYMNCELDKLKFTLPEDYQPGKYFHKGHKLGNGWNRKDAATKRRFSSVAKAAIEKVNKEGLNRKGAIKRCKPVVCLEDGKEFPSVKQAAEYYGISKNLISWSIHKPSKAKGLTFRLKSQLEKIKEVI